MSRILLVTLFVVASFPVYGQSINRVEVSGVLLSNSNDVEAVTVFNKSSNRGTITDEKGEFTLNVGLNDVIEISALQFQAVTVLIDLNIIESKQLKIQLVEEVNKLDAVTLSSGLSGNMAADVSLVKNIKPIMLEMGNMNVDFEYNDDKAFDNAVISDHFTSITEPGARKFMPDLIKIIGFFTKSKKDISLTKEVFVGHKYEKPKDLLSVFSLEYIQEQFEIPEDKIQLFLAFVENNGISLELLKPENEIQLIEFLVKQSQQFLIHQHVEH
ncbi:carboxypeptidase-like regulatory domain-containing protein [Algibacter sp. R77976]|uniref:carboxypeptidase-like regulatory domain-containing protein n=1 Tax=Algibacter sp. R77976 TaxID=3093873 RepID=UPI0037CB9C96